VQAIRFHYRPVRYLASRFLGRGRAGLPLSRAGFVSLDDVDPPALPGPDWVRLEVTLAGICGTDLSMITAQESFTLEPFGAYPFTLGHEIVGRVAERGSAVTGWEVGERAAIHPMLACEQRALPRCAACRRGEVALCENVTGGELGTGFATGFHPRVGGGWSRWLVAHQSQLLRLGDVPDTTAVLTEPFGVALRGVAPNAPRQDDVVLVVGAGTIGVLTVAALRAIGWAGAIAVLGRYAFQRELAGRAGATTLLASRAEAFRWAESLPGARRFAPSLAPAFIEGGPKLIYDTVGSEATLRDALALSAAGGRIVMLGAITRAAADWTRLWHRQLSLLGVIAYGDIPWRGGRAESVHVAAELIRAGTLRDLPLVSHTYPLAEYRDAIATALDKRSHGSAKVVFRPEA
jgi:L-iditol 2-dehydrogenase